MKVYIAGPMTHLPQFNFPTFDAAAADLRARGYEVVSPAELDDPETRAAALASPDGDPEHYDTGSTWGDFLARDVKLIADEGIEAIVVLDGWERSRGARLETFVGRLCGVPIFSYSPGVGSLSVVPDSELEDAHAPDEKTLDLLHRTMGVFDPCLDEPESIIERTESAPTKPGITIRTDDGPVTSLARLARHEEEALLYQQLAGEERVTNTTTGGEKGRKRQRMELLPWDVLMRDVSPLYAFGATKYADNNWRKGYDWSLSFGAMMRHASQFWAGEGFDDETNAPHMASVVFHALALLLFAEEHPELDDRPGTVMLRDAA